MSTPQDCFGTDAQRRLLAQGLSLFDIVRDDPRFTYYGRTVGLAGPSEGTMSLLASLTRLQGNSHYAAVPNTEMTQLCSEAGSQGLSVVRYARWEGATEAHATATAILRDHALPDDLTLHRVQSDSPTDILRLLSEVALACGVLPPSGAVLRGRTRPGLALLATDRAGRPVACAGAASYLHPDHPMGRTQCWWGMLATHPDRRGERLALILGATALREAQARFGFSQVFTGVEPGNAASEAVCRRMGLVPADTSTLSVADASLLPGGRMTR